MGGEIFRAKKSRRSYMGHEERAVAGTSSKVFYVKVV